MKKTFQKGNKVYWHVRVKYLPDVALPVNNRGRVIGKLFSLYVIKDYTGRLCIVRGRKLSLLTAVIERKKEIIEELKESDIHRAIRNWNIEDNALNEKYLNTTA